MSAQNILRSTAALTISGIISKTIDFAFRAFYSTKLGAEGMGIFSLVFSFHSIILTFATGGLGVAVSKTVSEQYSLGCIGNIKKIMRIALLIVSLLSITMILATCFFAHSIASSFLNEPRTTLSLVCLSPSILFMSISYCIKGYFYASRKVLIPASSEFLEQAVKISSITILLNKMLPLGLTYGCAAVFLGISIGEFSSCLYLSYFYFRENISSKNYSKGKNLVTTVVSVAFPAMLTSLSGSILRMQENVLIVSSLKKSGLSHAEALSQYGTIHGMVMPLIIFPLTLLSSCFTLLVPEISRANSMKSRLRLSTLVSRLYRFTAFGGFLVCTIFLVFSRELSTLVYSAPHISNSVFIIAFFCPIMFADSVSCGILNGLGKQKNLLVYSFSDSILRIAMIIFLTPHLGIRSIYLIIFVSNMFTAVCTFGTALKHTKIPIEFSGWFLRHIVVAFMTYITLNTLSVFFNYGETALTITVSIGAAIFIYSLYSSCLCKTLRGDITWLTTRMLQSS